MTNHFGKIGIIGGSGWVGKAMLMQMLKKKYIAPKDVWVSNRSGSRKDLESWPDINVTQDNQVLADHCDTIILSVRPHDFPQLKIHLENQLVISVMAGVLVSRIQALTQAERIVRSMPNAAVEIGLSYTPWYANDNIDPELFPALKTFFNVFGGEDQVNQEKQIDFFTALTGSGQGWLVFFQHCLMQAGIQHQLEPHVAEHAVRQLFLGMGALLAQSKESTPELINILLDYEGVTTAGLRVMLQSKIEQEIGQAIETAYQKSSSDMTNR